jgi:hypothetical protein
VHATGEVDDVNGPDLVEAIRNAGGEVVPDDLRRTGPTEISYRKEPPAPQPVKKHLCESGLPVTRLNGRYHILNDFGMVEVSGNPDPKLRRATKLSDIATGRPTDVTDKKGDSVKIESYASPLHEIDRYERDRQAYDNSDLIIRDAELGYERQTEGEGDRARETAWVDRTRINEIYDSLALAGRDPQSPHAWRGRARVPQSIE